MAAPNCGESCYRTVARSATVHSVTVTQRGELSAEDREALIAAVDRWERANLELAEVRQVVVAALERASFREVAGATGFSTNTLQRWKREAQS